MYRLNFGYTCLLFTLCETLLIQAGQVAAGMFLARGLKGLMFCIEQEGKGRQDRGLRWLMTKQLLQTATKKDIRVNSYNDYYRNMMSKQKCGRGGCMTGQYTFCTFWLSEIL